MQKTAAVLAFVLSTSVAHAARPADYLVSQFAAHEGDLTTAATRMQGALAGDPSSMELREDAFVLTLLAGSPAARDLARSLPSNPLAQLLLAVGAARDGDWQRAELGFAELPHQGLADALRPLLVAWAQQAQGMPDRAMDTLQPALGASRLGAIALLHAALIADAAHRDGLAQRLYADLARAQTQPSLQLAQILANWQARSGDLPAARTTIGKAVAASPEIAIAQPGLVAALAHPRPPTPLRGIAQVLVEAAAVGEQGAGGQGGGDQAGHEVGDLLVQVALTAEPGMTEARLLASEIASAHREWQVAAAALEGVPDTDPLRPVVQLRLASLYDRDGRAAEAERVLTRLADAFPDRPEPLAQLGDVLAGDHRYADAVSAYDRAIALMAHPVAGDWGLFYARGAVLERLHEWPRAQADMNRALELSPEQPVVLNFLGYSMADRNQNLSVAQDMIQRALHARPNDGAIVDSLGWVKLRLGDTREALRLLERAAELEPEDPSITGHLGDAYWTAGRHVEAEDQWRRALVLKPDPEDRARIEARLKNPGEWHGFAAVPAEHAPAKINLFLHVTGRRPDGYHLLDSLAVFADAHDRLTAAPGDGLSLALSGPFGRELQAGPDNLVLRAARALAQACGITRGAALALDKNLPVASGIGGGSADAAATLRLLARLWALDVSPDQLHAMASGLGADVPVCVASRPARMSGVGDVLGLAPVLPPCGLVLVNPGAALSTQAVFGARHGGFSPPAVFPEGWPDAASMASDLDRLHNDLESPAMVLCPAIADVLAALRAQPGCRLARMSGSGATCFALFGDPAAARTAASSLARPGWWTWGGGLYDAASAT